MPIELWRNIERLHRSRFGRFTSELTRRRKQRKLAGSRQVQSSSSRMADGESRCGNELRQSSRRLLNSSG